MKPIFILRLWLLVVGYSLSAFFSASAQSWSGATNGDWLTTTNWSGGVAAGSTTSSDIDIAVFNVNANNTISLNMGAGGANGNYYLGAIDNTNATARIIQNTSGTTGLLTLNGATVNSVANTILRNSTSSLLTIGNSGSGSLGLVLGNATANVIQITSTGGITINSIISGGGGITRQGGGSGILTLAGNNSYTGVTAINAGVISISNSNALGSTGTGNGTTIAATGSLTTGGHLQLSGGINSAENITITGGTEASGYNGAIRNSSGNNTLSGNIILSSLTSGVRLDTAAGNLILSGNISQTGSTQSFSLAPASGTTITVNNAIANNGGIFQTLSSGANGSAGTTILAAVNGTGIGATNVAQNSTLQLGITNALNTTANLSIAAFGGSDQGTFNLNGFDQTINALTSNATGANRIVRNNNATTASILTVGNGGGSGTFNGRIVDGSTATLALVKTGAGTQTLSGANTYTGSTSVNGGTLSIASTGSLSVSTALVVGGGSFSYSGGAAQTVNGLTVNAGNSVVTNTNTGTTNKLNLGAITRNAGGGSVNFSNASATNNVITTTSSTSNGILGAWATLGPDWATKDGSNNIVAYTAYANVERLTPGTIADGSTTNVRILEGSGSAGDIEMAASGITAINTLLQSASGGSGSASVNIGDGNTLRTTGLMVASGAGSLTIGAATGSGTVTAASAGGELIALNQSSNGMTINSVIANHTSASSLTKLGTGILNLSGNNSYTGLTTISTGNLSISHNNALGGTGVGGHTTIRANGDTTGGGFLQLSGSINTPENITITGTTEQNSFAAAIQSSSGNNTLSGNITLAGSGTIRLNTTGTGTLTFAGNITQSTTSHSLAISAASGTIINMNNGLAINGGILRVFSPGKVVLKGASGSGIGNTIINQGGTIELGITDALNTAANLNIGQDGATTNTFDLASFNQTIGGLTSTGSTTRQVINSVSSTNSIFTIGNGGGDFNFAGTILNNLSGTGTVEVRKTGSGNQTLSGTNTFTGGTQIDNGILTLGHATDTLANTGAVNVNGGTLALGTNTDTVGAVTLTSGSITGSGTASEGVLTGTGSAFDVRSGSVSAKLAGSVGLTKSTAGTVTLSATNTYTGATNINGGTLQLDGSTHASSTVAIGTAGTLTGTGTVNGNATLTGSGIINKASGTIAGTLGVTGGNWNGNGAVTGLITSSSGTFTIGNGANLTANGNVNVTGGTIAAGNSSSTITGSLNYTSSSNSSFAGIIAGSGKTLTMNSANTRLSLTGVHSYTGATNITAGTLEISGTGSINSSSGISVASGAHFKYNSSTALTPSLTLNAGATLSGSGKIATALTLNSLDSVLAPGNSPGIQTFDMSQNWQSFTYEWELNDWVNSVVGTDIDQIQITGGLTLSGTSYALNILSLDTLNAAGLVGANGGNTFTETSKSWTILTTTTGITGFNASYWTLNKNGFLDAETGNWSLASTGNDLVLSYTVIPEPKAALLGGLGILLLFRRRR